MSSEGVSGGGRRRLVEVDRVTGFAIFLVVIGHVVARQPPDGNEWYVHLKFAIYQFHMPLFMFMSGTVFGHTHPATEGLARYRDWAGKKIVRLAPGFLIIGAGIIAGKALFRGLIHVDNVGDGLALSVVRLFLAPTESVAGSLWYIYVLLEFYLIFPILIALFRGRALLILAFTVVLHLAHIYHIELQLPKILAFHAIAEYALYFWLGAMASAHYDRVLHLARRAGPACAVGFAVSFATIAWWPWLVSKTAIGLASIPAALYLVGLREDRFGRLLEFVSGYTFVIYLLNTIAIGLTKGVMLKAMSWDGPNFLLFFVVLTTMGMAAPILAQRWIFSRNRVVARIMN